MSCSDFGISTKQYDIKYFEITSCVGKTHWKGGASNKKSIR
jgi:hypothetical protein